MDLLRLAARLYVDSGRNRLQRAPPEWSPAVPTHTMRPALVFFTSASSGAEIDQLRFARGFPRRPTRELLDVKVDKSGKRGKSGCRGEHS